MLGSPPGLSDIAVMGTLPEIAYGWPWPRLKVMSDLSLGNLHVACGPLSLLACGNDCLQNSAGNPLHSDKMDEIL